MFGNIDHNCKCTYLWTQQFHFRKFTLRKSWYKISGAQDYSFAGLFVINKTAGNKNGPKLWYIYIMEDHGAVLKNDTERSTKYMKAQMQTSVQALM